MTPRTKARQVDAQFTPDNYTPTEPNMEGHLEGIDAVLGGGPSVAGIVPSNDADADHDILFGTGKARASNDNESLDFATPLVKRIDAVWAVGTGNGGLFSGATLIADSIYHLFVIRLTADGSLDAGFDDNISATNIPAGYSSFKRIGSVLTDSSSNIIAFVADEISGGGLEVKWVDPPLDLSAATATTAALVTLQVPTGFKVKAHMNVSTERGGGGSPTITYLSSPDQNDEVPSETVAPLSTIISHGDSISVESTKRTNTSGQIRRRSDDTGGTLSISTLSYIDERI